MRTRNRILALFLLPALCVGLLAGCAPVEGAGEDTPEALRYEVTANPLEDPREHELPDDSKVGHAAWGAEDFAFRLSAELVKDAGDQNFVCSPYSVWLPLAALTNGTQGDVQRQMLSALGCHNASVEELNRAASRMLYELTCVREQEQYEEMTASNPELEGVFASPLTIANLVLVRKELSLRDAFVQSLADCYLGQALGVDFADPATVEYINQWASDHTDGLVTDLVEEFSQDTVMTMANAIYFSDHWSNEFDPELTREDVFCTPTGESTAQFMAQSADGWFYYENPAFQAVSLPFAASRASMYILLPKEGDAAQLLETLDWEQFYEITEGCQERTGTLLLPKFTIDSGVIDLKNALLALDIPLFDGEVNPLGGLIQEDVPLWMTGAIQKAVIEVDEKGTTAAAVTAMDMGMGGPMPTEPFEMICNKPFVFIISRAVYDGHHQILFTGVVNDPGK